MTNDVRRYPGGSKYVSTTINDITSSDIWYLDVRDLGASTVALSDDAGDMSAETEWYCYILSTILNLRRNLPRNARPLSAHSSNHGVDFT